VRRPGRVLIAAGALLALGGAWWSGGVPCALVGVQPACQLIVAGGPVLDTSALVTVGPPASASAGSGVEVVVREPAGRLLVTTIEVWEPDGVSDWWAALRDPDVDLIARARLVPDGGDLEDVAEAGRVTMGESQQRAAALALSAAGLIPGPDVPGWAWPVEVTFATDQVGGPSAGLMLAIAIVARIADQDPTNRTGAAVGARPPLTVAGTGALDAAGRVVGVGGVTHKLRSVIEDAGGGRVPDAFLLAPEDLPVARRATVARDVLLVPVSDLATALDALAVLAGGGVPDGAVLLAAGGGAAR
jgi:Lon-like protease